MGNGYIRALILYISIGSHFASQLFIHRPRVHGFRELMRHRASEDELLSQTRRLYLDRDAHIETAVDPLFLWFDDTGGLTTEL